MLSLNVMGEGHAPRMGESVSTSKIRIENDVSIRRMLKFCGLKEILLITEVILAAAISNLKKFAVEQSVVLV